MSSGSGGDDFLPVSERPEWAGVAPRPLPPQVHPVVAIERDELMGDLMDYFWAAVAANECRWAGRLAGGGGKRVGEFALGSGWEGWAASLAPIRRPVPPGLMFACRQALVPSNTTQHPALPAASACWR